MQFAKTPAAPDMYTAGRGDKTAKFFFAGCFDAIPRLQKTPVQAVWRKFKINAPLKDLLLKRGELGAAIRLAEDHLPPKKKNKKKTASSSGSTSVSSTSNNNSNGAAKSKKPANKGPTVAPKTPPPTAWKYGLGAAQATQDTDVESDAQEHHSPFDDGSDDEEDNDE